MKTKALKGGALLLAAFGFALTPSFNAMALEDGSIDYGGNVNQINEQTTTNVLVQAMNDGGYVIAGVTGDCQIGEDAVAKGVSLNVHPSSCTCGDSQEALFNMRDDVNLLEGLPICGYVVRYKADGTKVWQTDLTIVDYPSTGLTFGYDYDEETGEKIPVYRDYVNVEPIQLKETTAGIGLMTTDSDYFLFDANNGNVVKSYSHIDVEDNSEEECPTGGGFMSCEDSVNWDVPYWTNVNSDGSTTYFNDRDSSLYKKTTKDDQSKLNYVLRSAPVTTQDNVYVVECAERPGNTTHNDSDINYYEREYCDLVQLDENFQNRKVVDLPTENEFFIAGASDHLVTVGTEEEGYDSETGKWTINSLGAFIIKDTSVIAQREANDLNFAYDSDEDAPEIISQLGAIMSASYNTSDMVETDNGIAVAVYYDGKAGVAMFDKNLNLLNEVELDMSNNDVIYNDLAFLRDGSLTAAGADTSTSDYYNIDGDKNGMHVHYSSIITPNQSGTGAPETNNPNTLDNTIVFGVGFIAILSTAGCAMKRLARRR